MSKLQVDDIVNKDDTGSVGFSRGAVVTGVATATTFSGNLSGATASVSSSVVVGSAATINASGIDLGTGIATATSFSGALSGNVTGNVTGNINSASASGISTVGILTAYSSVTIGSTNVLTAIDGKTSPGKAIALSMVFG
jgi:hypothetical protein